MSNNNNVVSTIPSTYSSQHLMSPDTESVITEEDRKSLRRRSSEVEQTFSTVTSSQWFTVGVLCFINLINYMDRFTIAGESHCLLACVNISIKMFDCMLKENIEERWRRKGGKISVNLILKRNQRNRNPPIKICSNRNISALVVNKVMSIYYPVTIEFCVVIAIELSQVLLHSNYHSMTRWKKQHRTTFSNARASYDLFLINPNIASH